ncbi:hypothetical protein [Bacillus sp. JCM 19041]|uniref:hypothetical protein n=1 Tax=Bacillus sp. JCM 19041 TaxID=1460637 RepID=UPI000AF3989C
MVSFALILLLFATGIPLLLILMLYSPFLGLAAIAAVCINWFIISWLLHRKHHRVHHAHKKDGLS